MVKFCDEGRQGVVDLVQGEELTVAQGGEHSLLNDLHSGFDLGFITRFAHAGGENGDAVVARHLLVSRIDVGFVTAGGSNAGLEVVRDDKLGDAAEVGERTNMGAYPVRDGLGEGGMRESVTASPEHGHKDLGRMRLAAYRVDEGNAHSGIVDEEFLAGLVVLPHARVQRLPKIVVALAELAVCKPVRGGDAVLFPEQT